MSVMRSMALTLILSVLVAILGVWGGAQYVMHRVHRPTPLHELVHEKLNLTADQERRIAGMERDHEARRQALEAEMRAANAQLAQAFQQSHAYTPQVQAAIDRFHRAMGELQKETIVHTLAMRAVLTPDQTARFDETVVRSLTEDTR
ncbi:Spy/CpxP family protein refolding chaperone [Phenylobacterium haematophilum]|uniref:Spy/CpxP family protein refolding chaperone n=3 Tax=Caulobacteraceae TaxID=76892 RepID=A0A840A639_9CAUL|nr:MULTISPECIES: periplasmic heavy metal sensor [unclassified Phenylobacterium]MBB3892812.1 Spy/CpxP family protein refolding chaperone [Phenylobacterium haematophilum]